jgi:hypothetical protein
LFTTSLNVARQPWDCKFINGLLRSFLPRSSPPVRVEIAAAPVDFSLLSLSSYVFSQVVCKEPIPGKTFRLAYLPNASGS